MVSNSNNQSWALRPWGTPEWLRQRPANPPISALIRCLRRWGFPFPKARGGADQYGALAGWSVVVQVVLWGWTGRRRQRTTRGRRRGRAALRGCGESQGGGEEKNKDKLWNRKERRKNRKIFRFIIIIIILWTHLLNQCFRSPNHSDHVLFLLKHCSFFLQP